MDKYVVREPRIGADFPQSGQMVGFGSSLPRNNNMLPPENMYLGGYGEFPMPQNMGSPGYFGIHQQISSTSYQQPQPMNVNIHQGQAQMMSGIDPRYLAAYNDGHAQFIAMGNNNIHTERPSAPMQFGTDYENRSLVAPDRYKTKMPTPQTTAGDTIQTKDRSVYNTPSPCNTVKKEISFATQTQLHRSSGPNVSNKNSKENVKDEPLNKIISRSDKLKALHKDGLRVFSGPIEKVLKWHKALQEIGVTVMYEIVAGRDLKNPSVAKCVSVRPGESCAKNLVVRDDGGPAMQVVYYEIDFLLPELKPPCTVRVIGRMMPGTCRLQAFSVRAATGADVATLPRRAAVADHHVAKLCKDYGVLAK